MAEAAVASGNNDLAVSMYVAAAASDPSNVTLQLRCADVLTRNGKTAQAREMLTERLRTNAHQPDLTRALALIDLVSGQPEQAVVKFNEALAINPSDVRALVDKAVAFDLLGQHTSAQVIYQQVLARTPDDAVTTNDLAISMMLQGRTRQALDTLAPIRDADTSLPRLRVNLGILYAANGDVEQSRQLLADKSVSSSDLSNLTQALGSLRHLNNKKAFAPAFEVGNRTSSGLAGGNVLFPIRPDMDGVQP